MMVHIVPSEQSRRELFLSGKTSHVLRLIIAETDVETRIVAIKALANFALNRKC